MRYAILMTARSLHRDNRRRWTFPMLLVLTLFAMTVNAQERTADSLWHRFANPPEDARPMMRWWWFGPAVSHEELDREIAAMKAGCFGGFEVQPTYPLSPDDPAAGIANLPY